ncbi:molybdopterin-dependent oxidoreductase [Mucilaginibacter robiniae]|uniref:Molybdopterin-dependent oxidoreductase n=2 Tax=Mucilaginibacter robiniae TaxID=2728022 RepID=A0A7L5E6H8_9SPHI|nr:molybdopterin-dependent oxidoreductase [Mucilaginibacter robiniae]
MKNKPEDKFDKLPLNTEPYDKKKINRRTFLSSITFLAGAGLAYWGWESVYHSAREIATATAGAKSSLRRVLDANGCLFEGAVKPNHLSRTYPKVMAAKKPRLNGKLGITDKNIESWALNLVKSANETQQITLNELKKLPKTEFAFEFKCVEGWSQISHWGGVKFSDFVHHFGLQELAKMEYVGMHTPDNKYYVGIDMPSALHPQTLLCYEVSGQPLSPEHGAPLRLIIPTKYGIKNLKRIGTLYFSNQRPPDYWAERGYDYFSGL